jgi:hypothetical protein
MSPVFSFFLLYTLGRKRPVIRRPGCVTEVTWGSRCPRRPRRSSRASWRHLAAARGERCSPLGDLATSATRAVRPPSPIPARHLPRASPAAPPCEGHSPGPSTPARPGAPAPPGHAGTPHHLTSGCLQPGPRASLASPSAQARRGQGGRDRGCDSLPGSLSALDSTVAMAEAPVRVRAPRAAGKCSSQPAARGAATWRGGSHRSPAKGRRLVGTSHLAG